MMGALLEYRQAALTIGRSSLYIVNSCCFLCSLVANINCSLVTGPTNVKTAEIARGWGLPRQTFETRVKKWWAEFTAMVEEALDRGEEVDLSLMDTPPDAGKNLGGARSTRVLSEGTYIKFARSTIVLLACVLHVCFAFLADERLLVGYLKELARRGFPLTLLEVRMLAYEYAKVNGIPGFNDKTELAGRHWAEAFQERWKGVISLKKAHNLSTWRAMACNPQEMDEWFREYKKLLREFGIMDENGLVDPSRIWNADETPLSDVPKEFRCFGIPNEKLQQQVGGEKGNLTTLLPFVSAAGDAPPPTVIHSGKRIQKSWKEGMRDGTHLAVSDTGYIKAEIFQEAAQHFIRYLKRRGGLSAQRKHCLLLDGHSAHMFNWAFISTMIENHVEVIGFPAHSTNVAQPSDSILFKEKNHVWNLILRKFNREHLGRKYGKDEFFPLLNQMLDEVFTPENIKASFRETGMCPVDRSRIDNSKLGPSRVTERSESLQLKVNCCVKFDF